jgi:hypothetical protein
MSSLWECASDDDWIDRDVSAALRAMFAIPPPRIASPVNDGSWTTDLADLLDACGMRAEAYDERERAIGPATYPRPRNPWWAR